MTVKELKEKIKDLPDDLRFGTTGYFGEFYTCWFCEVRTTIDEYYIDSKPITILEFKFEDKGEEPE